MDKNDHTPLLHGSVYHWELSQPAGLQASENRPHWKKTCESGRRKGHPLAPPAGSPDPDRSLPVNSHFTVLNLQRPAPKRGHPFTPVWAYDNAPTGDSSLLEPNA